MKKELFTVPPCASPRLKWLRGHGVETYCSGKSEDFDGQPWNAWDNQSGLRPPLDAETGATEHDAIVALAIKRGWRLWGEENL